MSIATEIQRLQEAKADIKAAIEEKGVEVGNGLIDGYADKVDEVYDKGISEGKESQYDLFWDNFQNKGALKPYVCAFRRWDESAFYPKHDILVSPSDGNDYGGAISMFHQFNSQKVNNIETKEPIDLAQRLEDCGVILDVSRTDSFMYTFQGINVTRMPAIDLRGSTSMGYMLFLGASNLETIEKLILKEDGSQSSNDYNFQGCTKLKNITIEGVIGKTINFKDCPLSKASITSIINALSTTTGAKLTLAKNAVINEFGSVESEEWTELVASRSNWIISLV